MSAQLTDEEALNRVASYCSAAEHCRAEVNEKLQRWGIAYETIARILERLETEKYIDDERFCRAFVNDKFRFAKWGKMKIAQGLYMKKIPSDVAWRHLNEIDDEEVATEVPCLLFRKKRQRKWQISCRKFLKVHPITSRTSCWHAMVLKRHVHRSRLMAF